MSDLDSFEIKKRLEKISKDIETLTNVIIKIVERKGLIGSKEIQEIKDGK